MGKWKSVRDELPQLDEAVTLKVLMFNYCSHCGRTITTIPCYEAEIKAIYIGFDEEPIFWHGKDHLVKRVIAWKKRCKLF